MHHGHGSDLYSNLDWNHHMDYLEVMNDGLKFLEDVGAKPLGEGDAASQPTPRTEPQRGGEVTGVSAGSASPDLEVVTAPKPGSHRRGPPKRKTQDNGTKKSLSSNDFLRPTEKEVQGGQDSAGTTTHAQTIWESMRRIFSPGTHGLIKLMAILVAGALFLMMCCAGIWYCWNRKGSTSAPSEDQPKTPLSEKLTCHPRSLNLSPSAVLQPHFEGVPKPIPPKLNPIPQTPLDLLPSVQEVPCVPGADGASAASSLLRSTSAPSEDLTKTLVSEHLTCYPCASALSPSALLRVQPRFEGVIKPKPPKRDPLPLSPLALHPGQD
ncbi:uncharacterized protein LOC111944540 isoform X1 [Cyanistes caeruleus]|uniref:uncharacterized protein LOC111944540 isoform X1 n=1 Tax=Cyanistes caeruleus TaxID=156563 RepID=UPI000CDB9946|nr:uncharacterized protein LOC111944540 isoform X1 [Cyanistes caeruleus]